MNGLVFNDGALEYELQIHKKRWSFEGDQAEGQSRCNFEDHMLLINSKEKQRPLPMLRDTYQIVSELPGPNDSIPRTKIKESISVEPVIAHIPRWTSQAMNYDRFDCK